MPYSLGTHVRRQGRIVGWRVEVHQLWRWLGWDPEVQWSPMVQGWLLQTSHSYQQLQRLALFTHAMLVLIFHRGAQFCWWIEGLWFHHTIPQHIRVQLAGIRSIQFLYRNKNSFNLTTMLELQISLLRCYGKWRSQWEKSQLLYDLSTPLIQTTCTEGQEFLTENQNIFARLNRKLLQYSN